MYPTIAEVLARAEVRSGGPVVRAGRDALDLEVVVLAGAPVARLRALVDAEVRTAVHLVLLATPQPRWAESSSTSPIAAIRPSSGRP